MKKFIAGVISITLLFGNTYTIPEDFTAIQPAIYAMSDGDTLIIAPDVYYGSISYSGKEIVIASYYLTTGFDSYIGQTVLSANHSGSVVTFANGETSDSQLIGVTVTDGNAANGGGIYCSGANPTLDHVVVTGNHASYKGGGLVCYYGSMPRVLHCTFAQNTASQSGGAVYARDNSEILIVNSILWYNLPEQIYLDFGSTVSIAFSDISEGQTGIVYGLDETVAWLEGNISDPPEFMNLDNGDYHLLDGSACINSATDFFIWEETPLIELLPEDYFDSAPDMGSFEFQLIYGCTDPEAANYNPEATIENGTCDYAPQLSLIPDQSIYEDTHLELVLSATDLDWDYLYFSAGCDVLEIEISMNIDTLTAVPDSDWFGDGEITVTVSDGEYQDEQSFALSVLPVNDPPVISPIPPQEILENGTLAVSLSAVDIDSELLDFSAEWNADHFDCTVLDDELFVSPVTQWHGIDTISVSVSDSEYSSSTEMTVTVVSAEDDLFLSLENIDYVNNTFDIRIRNESIVSGFQFEVTGANVIDTYGGITEEIGFVIISDGALMLGFSEFGAVIEPGDQILTTIQYEDESENPICLEDYLFLIDETTPVNVVFEGCLTLGQDGFGTLGDLDQSGVVDVLDLVIIVNLILTGDGSPYQYWSADLNEDGDINIMDILIEVQNILAGP